MKGKAIIFSAPSGAGKTTIVNHLVGLDLGLEFSISACSRPPRRNEVHGKDYYFMSVSEFSQRIAQEEFLEWEEVYKDHYYGTLKSELERIWNMGKHVIFDVDVVGGINLKKTFGVNALAVFVQAPSMTVLEQRLRERSTDPEEIIRTRIAKAKSEIQYADQFDVILINDSLDEALTRVKEVLAVFLSP